MVAKATTESDFPNWPSKRIWALLVPKRSGTAPFQLGLASKGDPGEVGSVGAGIKPDSVRA